MERLQHALAGDRADAKPTSSRCPDVPFSVVPRLVGVSCGCLRAACSSDGCRNGGCACESEEERRVAAKGPYERCAGEGCERCRCGGGRGQEPGQPAVMGGSPAVGEGSGLQEGEVAANRPDQDGEHNEQCVRAWEEGEARCRCPAHGDQKHGPRGRRGAPGEGGVQGAAEGLSGTAETEGPCGLGGETATRLPRSMPSGRCVQEIASAHSGKPGTTLHSHVSRDNVVTRPSAWAVRTARFPRSYSAAVYARCRPPRRHRDDGVDHGPGRCARRQCALTGQRPSGLASVILAQSFSGFAQKEILR